MKYALSANDFLANAFTDITFLYVVLKNISYELDLHFLILSKLPKFMDNKKCTTVHIQSGLYVNLVPFRIYNKTFLTV